MLSIASVIAHLTNRGRLVPSGQLGQHGRLKTTLRNSGQLLDMVKSVIPPLEYSSHKGDSGRIGIIGGCQEYTGAPYFAAITALKVGADLSHVFCTNDSATVIKSYSPELIVHPILDTSYDAAAEISEWLPRLHAVVVGPGLGRSEKVIHNTKQVIEQIKERKLPIVIDADGLYLVTQYPEVIKNYERAILTPNVVEFSRLYEKVIGEKPISEEPVVSVRSLCEKMGHVTIVCKGENDIISNGTQVLVCCGEGSARRCGGQGDLLSGSMGTFSFWAHSITDSSSKVIKYCPSYLASAKTVRDLLLHAETTVLEKWLPAETVRRIMRTVSAGSHLSCTEVSAGSKRSRTVSAEAKYNGQSLQEAKIGGLVYTLW